MIKLYNMCKLTLDVKYVVYVETAWNMMRWFYNLLINAVYCRGSGLELLSVFVLSCMPRFESQTVLNFRLINDLDAIKIDYMIIITCMLRNIWSIFMLFYISNMFGVFRLQKSACFPYVIARAISYTRFLVNDVGWLFGWWFMFHWEKLSLYRAGMF